MKKAIKEAAVKLLSSGYVCDNCLGRQFSKAVKGRHNMDKGRLVRRMLEKEGISFPQNRAEKCMLCENFFTGLGGLVNKKLKGLNKMDLGTFMVGVRMSDSLVMNEESLWEKTGAKYSESIKADISWQLSEIIKKKTGAKIDHEKPDVLIIFDVQKMAFEVSSNPVFVYGKYKKFSRGLQQTSSHRYKDSVEDIIAKPIMKATRGEAHLLHALGREDREARCLVWRPFVIEIKQPIRRRLNLKEIARAINASRKVKVAGLRLSGRDEIAKIKSEKPYKIFRAIVDFENPVAEIGKLKKLVGTIKQRTPSRVLGRKPDKTKHKKVKSIKWKRINTKRYQIELSVESGLYLHELITGDAGRTTPSVSQVLKNSAKIKEFDLIGLED